VWIKVNLFINELIRLRIPNGQKTEWAPRVNLYVMIQRKIHPPPPTKIKLCPSEQ
jgi:hypothetical protein